MQDLGLVIFIAKKYLPYCDRASDFDDLVQAGHLGLIRAKGTYQPDKGPWSTWAVLYMQNEMRAAIGLRGTKVKPEREAISLDAPITEDGFTLLDTLDAGPVDLQEGIDREQLCQTVRERVAALKDPLQREAVTLIDLGGLTYIGAAEAAGTTAQRIKTARYRGIHELRKDSALCELAQAYGLWRRSYEHYGLQSFRHSWTSRTEAEAFAAIEQETGACGSVTRSYPPPFGNTKRGDEHRRGEPFPHAADFLQRGGKHKT